VHDPITDIAAMKMVFPIAAQAAQTLGTDADLVDAAAGRDPEAARLPARRQGHAQDAEVAGRRR